MKKYILFGIIVLLLLCTLSILIYNYLVSLFPLTYGDYIVYNGYKYYPADDSVSGHPTVDPDVKLQVRLYKNDGTRVGVFQRFYGVVAKIYKCVDVFTAPVVKSLSAAVFCKGSRIVKDGGLAVLAYGIGIEIVVENNAVNRIIFCDFRNTLCYVFTDFGISRIKIELSVAVRDHPIGIFAGGVVF